ncbi:MAG: hypothetical protein KDC36_12770 [Thermoleophilia bacterium]|nr:hypothetical protein [Thermoleophilia bacterium]
MTGVAVLLLVLALGALTVVVSGTGLPTRRSRRTRRPEWVTEVPVSRAEAERRSLALLRSCVNPEEWAMFRDLGFLCVTGRRRPGDTIGHPRYRYLVYPHLPVVALLPRSLSPVREYCVQFPEPDGAPPLPTGDDVLAKWMTLRADEGRLLHSANMSSAGCQIPLGQIERDIARLRRWISRREFERTRPDRPVRQTV